MLHETSGPEAGHRLRTERERLGLSTREVERLSQIIAEQRKDPEYYISHTWVADLENNKFQPRLYKLHSLSIIYQLDLNKVLGFFGLDLRQAAREHGLINLPHTYLLPGHSSLSHQSITAPVGLREHASLDKTNLVTRMFEGWTEIPIDLLQKLDRPSVLCGYIGMEDYTLFPHIRPGSWVQIDGRQTKVQREGWQNEYDRPIYFVDLRDIYMCSWCEISGSHLMLIPSPQSRRPARHVRYPGEADIIGRVTAVTQRLADIRAE